MLYILGRQDIYYVISFEKIIKELDAKNIKCDDDENFRGVAPFYIRFC